MLLRVPVKSILCALALAGLLLLAYQRLPHQLPLLPSRVLSQSSDVPNLAHYVFLLTDPKADFPFVFYHYLSVHAAWYHLRPERIYLHTNARPQQLDRARQGLAGKWSQLILNMPGLVINHVELPTHTRSGVEISHIAHKSDFARVPAVRDLGGLYLDFDVFLLRDMTALRESGFDFFTGREPSGMVPSGVFLTNRQSKVVRAWAQQMDGAFDQEWFSHSNALLTRIAEQAMSEPRQVLVLEEAALAPFGWGNGDIEGFLEDHDDIPSPLEKLGPGDPLPAMEHYEDSDISWATNLNKSYIVHAYRIEDLNVEISPRSVLRRRSNFGRALYPVVRDMVHMGIVRRDEH